MVAKSWREWREHGTGLGVSECCVGKVCAGDLVACSFFFFFFLLLVVLFFVRVLLKKYFESKADS